MSLKIGLFGAGMIGREHAKYLSQSDELGLVAIADPMPAGVDLADEYGVRRYDGYADLLAEEALDGVVIALPNAMHADAAVAAMDAGVVPLVEKPLAGDLADAARIVDVSEATGIPVLVGHQRRFAPDIVAAREFIRSGELGDIVSVSLMSTWRKDEPYFDAEWRTKRGGGPVLINFIHDIDAVRYLVGEITRVVGIASSAQRSFEAPDTVGVVMSFENGTIGTGIISDASAGPWNWDLTSGYGAYFPSPPPPGDSYFIGGTKGALAIPSLTHYHYEEGGHWKTPMTTSTVDRVEANAYVQELAHFAKVITRDADPITSARDGYNSLAVAIAIGSATEAGDTVAVQSR